MAWILLLTACLGPSESNFAESYATELCRFDEYCYKSAFLEDYDDVDECVDEVLDTIDDSKDCDFDADEARDCLAEMRDARRDCDPGDRVPKPCYEALDCPGVLPSVVSAENFQLRYLEVYCTIDCGDAYLGSFCDNLEDYTSTNYACPEFDLEAALECLDEANWTCNEGYGYGTSSFPVPPTECGEVCSYGGTYYD